MSVTTAAGMHVDVGQLGWPVLVGVDEVHVDAGFFNRFTARRLPRRLARVDVPTGLHPHAEPAMKKQQDSAASDDERRAGDVHGVGVLVARAIQPGNLGAEAGDAGALALVDRVARSDRSQHVCEDGFVGHEWRR